MKNKKVKAVARPAKGGPSAGCGTGAGGFKAGNQCAKEDGIPRKPLGKGGALKKADPKADIALAMMHDEFPPQRIVDEYDEKHIITWGTRFGPLYEDALKFLHTWGVKCEGVDIPEMGGESGPYDENNPAPAD